MILESIPRRFPLWPLNLETMATDSTKCQLLICVKSFVEASLRAKARTSEVVSPRSGLVLVVKWRHLGYFLPEVRLRPAILKLPQSESRTPPPASPRAFSTIPGRRLCRVRSQFSVPFPPSHPFVLPISLYSLSERLSELGIVFGFVM